LLAPDVRLVFLWQMVLGVLANLLIYWLARRSFGDTVGALAGAMAVLYAPLMYYELILLREAPLTFAALACVAAVSWALEATALPAGSRLVQ
jgi:4-amino-4-deoxy-L-arabinose transferase-like glycosyltransferase